MNITNIQRKDYHGEDEQIAYDVILTIDNSLLISDIQVLYTYADTGEQYYVKWPSCVQFFNNMDIFSVEEQILRGLNKVPMKEKILHKLQTGSKSRFGKELIQVVKEKL